MRMVEKRVSLMVAGAAVLFALTMGFFAALGIRSVVAGPGSAAGAAPPNPGHGYDQVELPAGTWAGLDADTLDGLNSDEIHDADDRVSNADFASSAGNASYATNAGSANTANTATNATSAGYATSAGSASTANTANSATSAGYATSAGDADTLDGLHSNQIHDADNYVGNAGDADTVDGQHASSLHESLVCGTATNTEWVDTGATCVMSPVLSAAFQLTGGGCEYQTNLGNYKLLYASWPITWNRWVCCFKDHSYTDNGWITATVIGCKTQ